MSVGFAEALAVVAGLHLLSSALSGVTRRTVLSTSVLAVAMRMGLSLAGVISLSAGEHSLVLLVELVLLLTLFSDGLLLENELLRHHWGAGGPRARDRTPHAQPRIRAK